MKNLWLALALFVGSGSTLFGNGGAWQTGIPATGNASASKNDEYTDVTIENETLKIDLHPEYADVTVRYRVHNTGSKVQQDFFFPVERWGANPDSDREEKSDDIDHYQISVAGKELKWTNVAGPKEKSSETKEGTSEANQESSEPKEEESSEAEGEKSEAEEESSEEEDGETTSGPFWQEDVSIEKPKERFKKISDTRYEWEFENLKPTLADDIRIVAHSKYDSYPTGYSEEELQSGAEYVIRGNQYFLEHTDYDATASSTLGPQGKHHYEVENIKGRSDEGSPWAEGAKDDGIGESITLNVKRPLPLYGIQIRPGYWDPGADNPWKKNNRVSALEITLNDERTFTETIPDETFEKPYLVRVRDYAKPVNKIKMVIKGVHRGTQFRDTCISLVELRAPLSKKPKIQGAR